MTTFIHVSPGADGINPDFTKNLIHLVGNSLATYLIPKMLRFAFESFYIRAIFRTIFQFDDAAVQGGPEFIGQLLINFQGWPGQDNLIWHRSLHPAN